MAVPQVPDADWLWSNEPCRAACPVHTDAGAYVTAIAEGRFRAGVSHRARAESLPFGLWARVRGAVRACVPARFRRRAGVDQSVEAIRDRTVRCRELRGEHGLARGARRGPAREPSERRCYRRRPGRTCRRVRTAPCRSSGCGVRGPGASRRHDGARDSRVPPPACAHHARDRSDHRTRHRRRDERPYRRNASTGRAPGSPRRAVPRGGHRERTRSRPSRTRPGRRAACRRILAQRQSGISRRPRGRASWSSAAATLPSTPRGRHSAPRRQVRLRHRPSRWPRPPTRTRAGR